MLRAEGLVKDFGTVRALNGLSFNAEPGEVYGLLGPNGAGKTTAMRLLSGLLRPTAGDACVGGYSILEDPHAVRQQVGLLTELPGLYLRLTPSEYLEFFAQMHGLRRTTRVEEMLRLVGLWHERRTVMRAFSKGMQQRVAIARTFLQDPPVLLLDEPTAALDPGQRRRLWEWVGEAHDAGGAVCFATQNLEEVARVADRVVVLEDGAVVFAGPTAEYESAAVDVFR